MASDKVLELTEDNFEQEVVNSDKPVLVDFWAEWCQPCNALTPTIEALAEEYDGKVKIGKVNTDNARQLATQFSISAIPTIMLFNNGEVVKKFVGLTSKKEFKAALDEV